MDYRCCVPCLLGLESPIADELKRLGLREVVSENGRVFFSGNEQEILKANICLRIGERVLIVVARFHAETFEELFVGTKQADWSSFIGVHDAFPVKGYCLKSKLFADSACQSIIKKAVVESLKARYHTDWFSETGPVHQIQFSIMKDDVTLMIDTSGEGLHKRGYRPAHTAAPLKETIAAAMVNLSRYRGKEMFCDPFCGSGTIPIEAALIARNIAPGINRNFSCEKWEQFPRALSSSVREEARSREYHGDYRIIASDIDPHAIELAKENAVRAGVSDLIEFQVSDATKFNLKTDRGILVTNPPYGERILDKTAAESLYRDFGKAFLSSRNWNLYLLSSHTEFERTFGKAADKKRKLYNGMIKCDLFMYLNNH